MKAVDLLKQIPTLIGAVLPPSNGTGSDRSSPLINLMQDVTTDDVTANPTRSHPQILPPAPASGSALPQDNKLNASSNSNAFGSSGQVNIDYTNNTNNTDSCRGMVVYGTEAAADGGRA